MPTPAFSLPASEPSSPNLELLHSALGLPTGDVHAPEPAPSPGEALLRVRVGDGPPVAVRRYEPPPGHAVRAVAVVAPATGVPQRYYRPFAQWLSRQGYAVFTLDYRGLAESRCPEGRTDRASMRDWMLGDLPAVLQLARDRAAQGVRTLPLVWVGHSLGGHALALLDGIEHLDAALTVGSQLPAYSRWPAGHARWGARAFFQAWLPLLVGLTGRLPAWALGGGLPLPGPAALDWSRWGQMPAYFLSDPTLQHQQRARQFRGTAQLWWVTDDWAFAPQPAVQALADAFEPGRAQVLRLAPADVGLRRLGHFGVFRREAESQLWPLLLDRLEAAVPALRR